MQYDFHRDRLESLDAGTPANLTSAYRDAKSAIVDATSKFETLDPSSLMVQVDFRDEETPASRSAKLIEKIDAALGVSPSAEKNDVSLAAH